MGGGSFLLIRDLISSPYILSRGGTVSSYRGPFFGACLLITITSAGAHGGGGGLESVGGLA